MRSLIWVLIALCLAGILVSLGSGLFHLSRGGGEEDSRKLARAMGGDLVFSGDASGGACFTLTMPTNSHALIASVA